MFYKTWLFLPFIYLLLVGGKFKCTCTQVSISSIADHEHKDMLQSNQVEPHKPAPLLTSYSALGSLSCMRGAKADFLLQFKGHIDNIAPQSEGQVAFIGCVEGTTLSTKESSILKSAMHAKNEVEKFLWQEGGGFVYWNKVSKVGTGAKEWMMLVGEETYKKLTSKQYAIYMLYMPSDASDYVVSAAPLQMDIRGKDSSLPNYQNIGLASMPAIEEQTSNGTGWLLKGKLTDASSIKTGFILAKEGVNPYHLVQKVIADDWPIETTSFNDEVIIVPGTLRTMDPPIVGKLFSNQAPIQGGNFKLICYLIQGAHYYLSQMEHIMPDVTESSLSQESVPTSITFTRNKHGLNVSNLNLTLYCDQVSGQVQDVTLSDYAIEYSVNDQVVKLPSDLVAEVFILHKCPYWRTSALESLFKKSRTLNSNAHVTDDGTICLIRDLNKVTDSGKSLEKSYIDFFSCTTDHEYEYMACVFSKEDHKLKFYKQREALSIKVHKAQPKEEPKPDKLKITLDNKEACITFNPSKWYKLFSLDPVSYKLPKVSLEPSGFDESQIIHRGFVINDTNIDKDNVMPIISKFIKSKKSEALYKNNNKEEKLLIFKEEHNKQNLEDNLYVAYYDYAKERKKCQIYISYWVQCNNSKIIRSEAVPVVMEWLP